MKKISLLLATATMSILSCTKTTTNNNNYGSSQPPFIVNGLTDVTLRNGSIEESYLYLTMQYTDSSQEPVTLSLSALPTGIAMDTTWITTGTPTFSSNLTLYDTSAAGANPGTYPMTLTATSASTKKTFPFNIKVLPPAPCTGSMVGKYINCYSCTSTSAYSDSVYADPTVVNKVWFTNFNNSGALVYGTYNCESEVITIPSQTVGSVTYQGSGYSYGTHYISVTLSSPTSCNFTDQ